MWQEGFAFLWQWSFPPLDQRKPHTIISLVQLLAVICLPTLAAFIRIRFAGKTRVLLDYYWKIGYFFTIIPIVLRNCFLHYTHFNDFEKPSIVWGNGDAYMGGCALSVLIFSFDFLFLAKDEEQNVRHANEYKKWIEDKYSKEGEKMGNGQTTIKEKIEKVTGGNGYTLDQPKYFPGTNDWLPFDMAMSPRCLGYVRGHSQRNTPYEAGYRALIESEKLAMLPKEESKKLRMLKIKHLIRIGGELCYTILLADAIMATLVHPSLLGISKHMKDNNGFMPLSKLTRSSTLGPYITPWFAAILSGSSIPIRMQMIHLFAYFFALLFTDPIKIPITISRFEPLLCPNFASCTSVQALWSRGWHQLPRRMYTVVAIRPSLALASKLKINVMYGKAIGYLIAFFISGIMHELSLEGLLAHIPHINQHFRSLTETQLRQKGYGFGAKSFVSTRFFMIQAIIIIFEEIWLTKLEPMIAKRLGKVDQKLLLTGITRKIVGWLWCTFWLTLPGMPMIDVWQAHGIMSPLTSSFLFSPLLDLLTNSKS